MCCIVVCIACIENLYEFLPFIKFTPEYSKKFLQFLDVTSNIENGTLKTNLFVKPMDLNQYLEYSSCHSCYFKKVFRTVRLSSLMTYIQTFFLLQWIGKWAYRKATQ